MKKLNSNHLKLIAITAMTADHIADLMFPGFPVNAAAIMLHVIGRLTAPIMFFFVCEGFFYTKNLKKYIVRMFAFAFISHFAYCFAFGKNFIPFSDGEILNQTSVMWTLAWSVAALYISKKNEFLKHWQKCILMILICAVTFPADWSSIAVMAILFMYTNRGNLKKQMIGMSLWVSIYAVVSFFFASKLYGIICLFVPIAYIPLKFYNGEKGKAGFMKWFFYAYYPAHLIIIGILRNVLYGDIPILF